MEQLIYSDDLRLATVSFISSAILSLFVLVAWLIARTNNLFSAAFLAGISSLLVATLYIVFRAPDVAFTEAAVGAGISTVFFLATIGAVGSHYAYKAFRKIPTLILSVAAGGLIYYSMLDLPYLGDSTLALHAHVANHYLEHSASETGVSNVVTSVLASYRGLDTLGEAAVIFTAGVGVLVVLGDRLTRKD